VLRFKKINGAAGTFACALALSALTAPSASAQGLLDALFGGMGGYRRPAPQSLPPQTSAYVDPFSFGDRRPSGDVGGPSVSYCVRTCDGRFFPLQRNANLSPADMC
jgi:hypothetical protein